MAVAIAQEQSAQYQLYVTNHCLLTNEKHHMDFHQCFWLPFEIQELIAACGEHELHEGDPFYRWCVTDKQNKKKALLVELLVLGTLHYLGSLFCLAVLIFTTNML